MRYSTDFGKTWMKWQPFARAAGTFSHSVLAMSTHPFRRAFYSIKINKYAFKEKRGFRRSVFGLDEGKVIRLRAAKGEKGEMGMISTLVAAMGVEVRGVRWPDDMTIRRKYLLATLEYKIGAM